MGSWVLSVGGSILLGVLLGVGLFVAVQHFGHDANGSTPAARPIASLPIMQTVSNVESVVQPLSAVSSLPVATKSVDASPPVHTDRFMRNLSASPWQKGSKSYLAATSDPTLICSKLMKRYSVVPGSSWGKLTAELQQRWTNLKCDEHLRNPVTTVVDMVAEDKDTSSPMVHLEGLPPTNPEYREWCTSMRSKHRVRPMKSWGTLTPAMVEEWKKRRCDFVFTMMRMSRKALPDCLAKQSVESSASFPLISIMAASTTRKIPEPSISRLALFTYLLPSLMRTLDCGFRYEYVLGYDVGDEFYDTANGIAEVEKWFAEAIQKPLAAKGISLTLRTVRVNNSVKKPGPVFIEMARAAYLGGATYFFRVNDDTELMAPWPAAFARTLDLLGSPFGVVGPQCNEGNDRILTHDFVHRTHMEIFEMNYYPPALTDWWMDDWISFVYGQTRTFKARSVPVIHHTGAHGQRYQVDRSHEGLLADLVASGKNKIRQFMLKSEVNASVLRKFDADNFKVGFAHRDLPVAVKSSLDKAKS